jgi:hypothetical protein
MTTTQEPIYVWVDKTSWIYDKTEIPTIIEQQTTTSQSNQIVNEAYQALLKSKDHEHAQTTDDKLTTAVKNSSLSEPMNTIYSSTNTSNTSSLQPTQSNTFDTSNTSSLQPTQSKTSIEPKSSTPTTEDTEAHFRVKSYSGFKKADIKKQWIQSILEGNIEGTTYWCADMICSGYLLEIWDTIFYVMSKHIYMANPKLPYLLLNRYQQFKGIILTADNVSWVGREVQLRNHSKMRTIFAEICVILCLSQKRHPVQEPKIAPSDFDLTTMAGKMRAKSRGTDVLNRIYRQGDDPPELFLPLLELTYSIYYEHNWLQAIYWLNWMLDFERMCIHRKDPAICKCYNRYEVMPPDFNVNPKYATDMIWLIWELLDILLLDLQITTSPIHTQLYKSYSATQAKKSAAYTQKIGEALKSLFCVRYNPAQKRKRRYILYFVFGMLCEPINTDIPFCGSPEVIHSVMDKIGNVYKYIQQDVIKHTKKEIGSNIAFATTPVYKPEPLSKGEIREKTKPPKKLTKKEEKEQKSKETKEKMSYLFNM